MKFKVRLIDGTTIYTNDLCFFRFAEGIGIYNRGAQDRFIPFNEVSEVYAEGTLIYL